MLTTSTIAAEADKKVREEKKLMWTRVKGRMNKHTKKTAADARGAPLDAADKANKDVGEVKAKGEIACLQTRVQVAQEKK